MTDPYTQDLRMTDPVSGGVVRRDEPESIDSEPKKWTYYSHYYYCGWRISLSELFRSHPGRVTDPHVFRVLCSLPRLRMTPLIRTPSQDTNGFL